MTVPWWAHWKAVDTMASFALAFIALLLLVLALYIWRLWWQFRAGKRHFIGSSAAGIRPPVWQLILYVVPLVLLVMFALAGYLVVQTLYGYNLFEILILFRLGAPPGVWLSGVMLVIVIMLWVLLLTFSGVFTRNHKEAV
jgi:hypothetical protein